ncbi:MAG: AI-2E family transporter, partial [Clostridia bacterium]|nr:AI-2E family transporter [Clostridia bacterium]
MENNEFTPNNINNNKPNRFKMTGMFGVIFLAFFLAMALSNILSPYFSQIISGLFSGIAPVFIGVAIAFIFYRLVDFIEKVILKNAFTNSPYKFAIKRTISITLVLLIIIGIIILVFSILIPKIIEIVQQLTAGGGDGANQIYNNVVNEICTIAQRWFGAEVSQDSIKQVLNYVFDWFMDTVGYLNNILELSLSVISGLLNVFISFLLAVLMLKDKEKISKFARRFTYSHFRKEKADEICVMTNNANKILFNYLITKLIEFAIIFGSL